jgi:hypothetical protein
MDYFKLFFPKKEIYDKLIIALPEAISMQLSQDSFNNIDNLEGIRGLLQNSFNTGFTNYYNSLLAKSINALKEFHTLTKGEDYASISEINGLSYLFESVFTFNANHDSGDDDDFIFSNMFNFLGIKKALDNIESNSKTYFINKLAIIKILENYIKGLTLVRFFDYLQNYKDSDTEVERYFEIIYKDVIKYSKSDVKSNHPYSTTNKSKKKAKDSLYYNFYKNLHIELSRLFKQYETPYGGYLVPDCIINLRMFRTKILSMIRAYIITKEEFEQKKPLYQSTWHKKILLYELLLALDLKSGLPKTEAEFRKLSNIKTTQFDTYKRNKVNAYFGT